MKGFGFSSLLWLIGVCAFVYLGHSSRGLNHGINVDQESIVKNWKVKEMVDPSGLHLEDYSHVGPVPISKASIRHKPIQHGTPVVPYIPKPKASPPPLGNL